MPPPPLHRSYSSHGSCCESTRVFPTRDRSCTQFRMIFTDTSEVPSVVILIISCPFILTFSPRTVAVNNRLCIPYPRVHAHIVRRFVVHDIWQQYAYTRQNVTPDYWSWLVPIGNAWNEHILSERILSVRHGAFAVGDVTCSANRTLGMGMITRHKSSFTLLY
jgi:hypothetical protein